jgi:hypothetical protein
MRVLLFTVLLVVSFPVSAVKNIQIMVFSEQLTLGGDCNFGVGIDSYGYFLCDASSSPHTVSFLTAESAKQEFLQPSIKLDFVAEDVAQIVEKESRLIDNYLHYYVQARVTALDKNMFQYALCKDKFCISLISLEYSKLAEILSPITKRLIGHE